LSSQSTTQDDSAEGGWRAALKSTQVEQATENDNI
jgi:hypothetical protein